MYKFTKLIYMIRTYTYSSARLGERKRQNQLPSLLI